MKCGFVLIRRQRLRWYISGLRAVRTLDSTERILAINAILYTALDLQQQDQRTRQRHMSPIREHT